MATNKFVYRAGAELPGITFPWKEEVTSGTYTDLDLSSGYTFTLELVDSSGTAALTKTTNIVGQNGSVLVTWATGELDLTPSKYTVRLRARETATSKDRDYAPSSPPTLQII